MVQEGPWGKQLDQGWCRIRTDKGKYLKRYILLGRPARTGLAVRE